MRITINVHTPLGNAIKAAANEKGLSVSMFVASVVQTHLDAYQKKAVKTILQNQIEKAKIGTGVWRMLAQLRNVNDGRM